MDEYFKLAVDATMEGMREGTGGPFGATLVDKNGEVIAAVGNTVLKEMDPSGHAELVAVREACATLNTLDLSGSTMYATCEPCPMCVAVMMWAGVEKCYYASTRTDAAEAGFSDQHLRDFLDKTDPTLFDLEHLEEGREDCAEIWTEFGRLKAERA
ncbi:nucleoside deaminase [Tessaracoccus sp. MC1865]|uniref:nucleoside deaminase n=1 Tax=Tessaracoccus sp. MC1865 TaxID=2760310 RepID=UPI001601BC0F|nr:nucleoside deaminase [Tessaracoccus sp. MC1865]MBB1484616.1 nucleoside deaminase [Tessaracoccus sp. MC1865]QTO38296.1 nucleoside deaminase [Tessaracoccus sp. MC1865]